MDLSFNSKMDAYYHQFFELQERLRRSEEERLKLEMRFNELVQISKEEEQAHYKKLRAQYKKFLDEDRKRQERNEKIIRTLERIESRVNMLTSKTERIKLLRRQYQSYLQRVTQRPSEKREYYPPKIAEELPSGGGNQPYDYSKKSCNIAMLKKAYGKTNEEKIEILDKYLQSLKSQKEPTVTENDPKDFNELKYFDEVSKKLNEGFNSNEANSIAEEIMNSIYARHYKPDLLKDEPKNVSKFTSPNSTVGFSDKERNYLMGDSNCNTGLKYNFSSEGKLYPNINSEPKFNGSTYPLSKSNFNPLEKTKAIYGFGDSNDTSKSEIDLKENEKQEVPKTTLTKTNYIDISTKNNESQIQQAEIMSTPVDLNREIAINKNETHDSVENIEFQKSIDQNLSQQALIEVNAYTADDGEVIDTTDETFESKVLVIQNNNASPNINASKSDTPENETTSHKIVKQIEQNESRSDVQETIEPHNFNENKNGESKAGNDDENIQGIPIDECNDQIYDESNLKPQDETNKNAELREQTNQHDLDAQPIVQLYGEDAKALDQYNELEQLDLQRYEEESKDIQQGHENEKLVQQDYEKGQAIENYDEYDQQYDENGQHVQHYDENNEQYGENGPQIQQSSENNESIPQYDENSQPIPENVSIGLCKDNSQDIQQYEETSQSIQHFDESGQPIQQYDGNNQPQNDEFVNYGDQPLQQFDENGQPLVQYDENGQPLLHYDENGQVIAQYDESGQPIGQYDGGVQQYDENGQPVYYQGEELVQYDEDGQIIQQYDEHGQPIVPSDPYQQYDITGQTQQYEGNQFGETDQLPENKSDLPEEQQVVEDDATQVQKKHNVLDLLDTDSESVKQNTSKITNDSDFDFSNG